MRTVLKSIYRSSIIYRVVMHCCSSLSFTGTSLDNENNNFVIRMPITTPSSSTFVVVFFLFSSILTYRVVFENDDRVLSSHRFNEWLMNPRFSTASVHGNWTYGGHSMRWGTLTWLSWCVLFCVTFKYQSQMWWRTESRWRTAKLHHSAISDVIIVVRTSERKTKRDFAIKCNFRAHTQS